MTRQQPTSLQEASLEHTNSWKAVVWLAFLLSTFGICWYVFTSKMTAESKVSMVLSFMFVASQTLSLSKLQRDITEFGEKSLTSVWKMKVWGFFLVSVVGFGWSVYVQPWEQNTKVTMGLILCFNMFACVAVAKTARDEQVLEELRERGAAQR